MNPTNKKQTFFDIPRNILEIPMTVGKSMSIIVETAVTNFILKQDGYDSTEVFKTNIEKEIKKKAGK